MAFRKIINDPVYGFITIDDPLIFRIISHPWYQRLRRISQMALSYLVYPGAMHSRLHHSLGAYHLMGIAVAELRSKGTEITVEEERAVKIAILFPTRSNRCSSKTWTTKRSPCCSWTS
jgi:uncharacterized protein